MGSSGNTKVINDVIKAVNELGYIAIIATAGKIKIENTNKVYSADYLPVMKIIEKSPLVICNGGSGSVWQALSRGIPVLGIPSNIDQFFTMDGVKKAGGGISIRPENELLKNVRGAVKFLINDDQVIKNTERLRKEILSFNSERIFAKFVSQI